MSTLRAEPGWADVLTDSAADARTAESLIRQLNAASVASLAFCRLLERWARGDAASRRRRIGVTSRPALEQAAERERRGLACRQLPDQRPAGAPVGGVASDHVGPGGRRCGKCVHGSNLDDDREDHRSAAGAVVDQLADLVVQVLLDELDLVDALVE